MELLNNKTVNLYAKATEHVPEIIEQTHTLIEKDYAYNVDGNVYFEVRKFTDFGKLSGQNLESLQAGARVTVDEEKRNPEDFVLWKREKPAEPSWSSPWGNGRPGWHIEDTAITTKYFGAQYDIHGGARDLIFPHHESEITIAESATGKKPFVKYWFHTGFLNVEGEKMSKSLGNFFTVQDVLKRYDSEVIRFFLLYTHYRSPIDFAENLLAEAETSYSRLRNSFQQLTSAVNDAVEITSNDVTKFEHDFLENIQRSREQFLAALDDDFNTREGIATLFEFSHVLNKYLSENVKLDASKRLSKNALTIAHDSFLELTQILGLFEHGTSGSGRAEKENDILKNLIEFLINLRNKMRAQKNYEVSDQIRDNLKERGIILEDTQHGTTWKLEN